MSYNVEPFLPRILRRPTLVVVAEKDDLTLWDLEIEAYNQLPTAKKKLVVVGDSTHMTLYSDRSLLEQAASAARDWFARHLLGQASDPGEGAGSVALTITLKLAWRRPISGSRRRWLVMRRASSEHQVEGCRAWIPTFDPRRRLSRRRA